MKKSSKKCPNCGGPAVAHITRKFDKRGVDPDFPKTTVFRCIGKCRKDDVFGAGRRAAKAAKAGKRAESEAEKAEREEAEAERYAKDHK